MKSRSPILIALVTAGAIGQATAQTTTRSTLTREGAMRVVDAAVAEAARRNAGGAIAVVDDAGYLLAFERIDGTFAAACDVSIGKARTAAIFRRPTSFFEEVITAKGRTSMIALADFTPLQGGVPIEVGGEIVGAVGVSGAHSAAEDEEIALAAAAAVNRARSAPEADKNPGTVVELRSEVVSRAFEKGAPLVEVESFKVHASRRDGPGSAEIHERDTDIIYVLDGTATLVTGGNVADAERTAPGELRGSVIEGGDVRRLARGDFVIVPSGVPHWFKEVGAPLLYYVVKVTDSACCGGPK